MSTFNDKTIKNVADVVSQIMEAELSPKQKAIAKLAEPKHKIDAEDLAKLRAGHKPVKEESEKKDEKEEYSAKEARAGKDIGKPGKMFAKIAASAAERYGSEEKGKKVAGAVLAKLRKEEIESETKKTFSEMVELYNQKGLKSLQEMFINEEPTEEQFVKELERQKRKAAGTAPESEKAKVAAAATKGVKNMPEETEIDERTLTEPEMEKREEVVKSMKKKMPEFKERYGKRAKEVLYATATKVAKGD